jgi:hypothetical protein
LSQIKSKIQIKKKDSKRETTKANFKQTLKQTKKVGVLGDTNRKHEQQTNHGTRDIDIDSVHVDRETTSDMEYEHTHLQTFLSFGAVIITFISTEQ